MEQQKIMEAEAPTVRVGTTPTGLMAPPPPQTHKVFYRLDALPAAQPTASKQQQHQQPSNGLCSGTTRVGRYQKKHSAFCLSIGLCCVQAGFPDLLSSGFYGAGEDNGGRNIDSPGGRHPNRTNGTPTTTPKFLQARCPSCRPTNSVKALKA